METKITKRTLASLGLCLLTVILSLVILSSTVYFFGIWESVEREWDEMAAYIAYALFIAMACFFISRHNPKSLWYGPVLCNAAGITMAIVEPTFWTAYLWIFICGGWLLSVVAATSGAGKSNIDSSPYRKDIMKRIKLVSAGFLLILIAMVLLGFDAPITGITYIAGIVLLFMGIFRWASKLHWFAALVIGGILFAAAWFAGIFIPQIVIDQYTGDERNEFLVHLIGSVLFWPGIVFILAGVARLFRWPLLSWNKREFLMRYRLHGKTTPANQKTTPMRPSGNARRK